MTTDTSTKLTKPGLVAALISLGFTPKEGPFPPSLKTVAPAATFTPEELSFAEYMVADNDFGGCWNDAAQIDMHTLADAPATFSTFEADTFGCIKRNGVPFAQLGRLLCSPKERDDFTRGAVGAIEVCKLVRAGHTAPASLVELAEMVLDTIEGRAGL